VAQTYFCLRVSVSPTALNPASMEEWVPMRLEVEGTATMMLSTGLFRTETGGQHQQTVAVVDGEVTAKTIHHQATGASKSVAGATPNARYPTSRPSQQLISEGR
jgi:hypothetical protein